MSNKQLFKEAIAEAKSIREAAIINAKEALEETLTPQIKSLLAQRLAEMEEEDDAPEVEDEDAVDDSIPTDAEKGEEHEEEGEEESSEEEEDLEIEDMSIEDLKSLIGDIVSQMIDQEVPIEEPAGEEAPMDMIGMEDEEEIDLDEILAELEAAEGASHAKKDEKEEDHIEESQERVQAEVTVLQRELNEAVTTINKLKASLSEVNVLNAKLLYINKLFKTNRNLSEVQIANIIATFDNATTAKEAQLVYESLKTVVTTKPVKKTVVEARLGMASKPLGVAPKKVEIITEVSEAVRRMQKLAGIIK